MVIDKRKVELAKCLEKRSVDELDKYIQANKETLNEEMVKVWEDADNEQREAIVNKLISSNDLVSCKLKCQANRWLKEHGLVHEIGRCKQ